MSLAVSSHKVLGNHFPQPLEGDRGGLLVGDDVGELGVEVLVQLHDPW